MEEGKQNYHRYLNAEIVYAAFICFWGCCVTLNDQLGGNDLSVFTYTMLSVAALGFLEPVKAVVIFMSVVCFSELMSPGIQTIENNMFSNIINSLSIAGYFYGNFLYVFTEIGNRYETGNDDSKAVRGDYQGK